MDAQMVLSRDELVTRLNHELTILLHLLTKVDATMLDYRPTQGQRSLQELLEYLTIFAPILIETIKSGVLDMDVWGNAWQTRQAAAKGMSLDAVRAEFERQRSANAGLIAAFSDEELASEMEMFGSQQRRGAWLVWMILCHYSAYRMQFFLYLKANGCAELGTMNLWGGVDPPQRR